MKKMHLLALLCLLAACTPNGGKPAPEKPPVNPAADVQQTQVVVAGVLEKTEATTYQYGTHAISGKLLNGNPENFKTETRFALKSDRVRLDDFVGKKVVITGVKVPGYPVDFGPDFLDVTAVEVDQKVSK
jgi:hypothetical protein